MQRDASKIGNLPLFGTVAVLAVLWLVAVVGLSLTIKREYLRTFVSSQTGYAYAQSYFHDHEGHDARRVEIFYHNERQWQAIRDRVRQWVLSVYVAWRELMPAWFTADLQARIPDEFMPAQIVHNLNVQAPDGRRPTLQNMGLLRGFASNRYRSNTSPPVSAEDMADDSSSSDGELCVPQRLQPTSSQPTPLSVEETLSMEDMRMIEEAMAASLEENERGKMGGEVPDSLSSNLRKPPSHDWDSPDILDEDEYQTMPEENQEIE
jgi:hypothetical protein